MGGKERRWRTVGDTAELSARRERTVEDGERRLGGKADLWGDGIKTARDDRRR